MSYMIFNIAMMFLAVFVIYWFWLWQPKSKKVTSGKAKIIVKDGVYMPANLSFATDDPIVLDFYRDEHSTCSEVVVFKALNKQFSLPFRQVLTVDLGKLPKGVYSFSCQMNMYQGKINVQ